MRMLVLVIFIHHGKYMHQRKLYLLYLSFDQLQGLFEEAKMVRRGLIIPSLKPFNALFII